MASVMELPAPEPTTHGAPLVRTGYCHRCGRPRLRDASACPACGASFIPDESGSSDGDTTAKPVVVGVRRKRVRSRILGVVVAALVASALVVGAYQAGRVDLLAGVVGTDPIPRIVQLGTDT